MKRKLTNEEYEQTEKGISRVKKEIKDLGEQIAVLSIHQEYRDKKREYEDFVRPHNRKREDHELKTAMNAATAQMKDAQDNLKAMQKHLEEGVDVKENKGIQ